MSGRFAIRTTPLRGVTAVERKRMGDDRGFLERMFCAEELELLIGGRTIVQINYTRTEKRGTVRGMHFQYPPYAETKFISCLRGEVFDVAVDLRRGSPTFLQWHGEVIGQGTPTTMALEEGFAHGFQTLTDDCELLYLHTAPYRPDAEGRINPRDPLVAIAWPLPITGLSVRDEGTLPLTPEFKGLAT